jgi:hypothetical protein
MPFQKAKTVEEIAATDQAEVARALARQEGFVIRTPIYGTPDAAKVPTDRINVHPHIAADGRPVAGGIIKLWEGQGHTDNEDWATWVAREWDGYKVYKVAEGKTWLRKLREGLPAWVRQGREDTPATEQVKVAALAAIVDGAVAAG